MSTFVRRQLQQLKIILWNNQELFSNIFRKQVTAIHLTPAKFNNIFPNQVASIRGESSGFMYRHSSVVSCKNYN
jgi:hypothetical protein